MVHRKVALLPVASPVTVDVGDDELVIVAVPETNDQAPVPLYGAFPAKVKVLLLQLN
jgi:hypothetical protein